VQLAVCADARSGQPQRAWVATWLLYEVTGTSGNIVKSWPLAWPSPPSVTMVTVSEDRDPKEGRGPQAVPPVSQAVPPVRGAPISHEWRTTTRRGAYGAMVLALTVGYTWISATRDWGWPLFPAAALLIVGIYVLLTTYVDRLPAIFGRNYDHSTKYTLWFDSFSQAWGIDEDDPSKLNLRAVLTFLNGGNQIIQFTVEKLEFEVDGVDSVGRTSFTEPLLDCCLAAVRASGRLR
jgi:hypothetical protein